MPKEPTPRILMLHGDASDEELMMRLLDASGWTSNGVVEIVCMSAPHPREPQPELYTAGVLAIVGCLCMDQAKKKPEDESQKKGRKTKKR